MCGIAGIINLENQAIHVSEIKVMTDILRHRGPDDQGFFLANTKTKQFQTSFDEPTAYLVNMALGHRRLSILDLSSHGHQPMSANNGKLWIVYNGEVFNYKEIRNDLKAKGYDFISDTDTEVILKAYQEWGQDCLNKFNGQWAFCIYDLDENLLFCARDRFGIKPFYYYRDEKTFVFASEIKALKNNQHVKGEINKPLILDFLWSGLFEHSQETHYLNVFQLLPGHKLILDLSLRKLSVEKYYMLSYTKDFGTYSQEKANQYADDIRNLLIDAVKLRLRADVPIGSCLSGGLDSSSIVMIINKLLKEKTVSAENIGEHQKTFSAVYQQEKFSERKFAQKIIDLTSAASYFIEPTGKQLWDDFQSLKYHQDDFFISTSVYAQWSVMRLAASSGVKVVLDGQGADELFAGYQGYKYSYLINLFSQSAFFAALRYFIFLAFYKKNEFLPTLVRTLRRKINNRYFQKLAGHDFKNRLIKEILGPQTLDIKNSFSQRLSFNLNQQLYSDLTRFSLPALLRYEDRNSMAHSLEARVPFLDYRLVEYVSNIPACYKMHNNYTKWVLRLAMQDILPKEILWRKDKMGFDTPEKEWLAQDLENNLYRDCASQMKIKTQVEKDDFTQWRYFMAWCFMNKHIK